MKKIMSVLIIGLLIAGVNAYAADGDFIVEGNLGIGTDTPGVELDVNGSINFSSSGTIKQDNHTVFFVNRDNESTFIGRQNFYRGLMNTAVGAWTFLSGSGDYNTAVGRSAMQESTTGSYNTAFGVGTLLANTTGFYNTAIGMKALLNNTIGNENTALGYYALYEATTGNNNIAVGKGAGEMITTGSNNIIIGYEIDAPDPVGNNQLSIGNLIFGTGIDGTGTAISSGNIGIGTATPEKRLDVLGPARVTSSLDGALTVNGTGVGENAALRVQGSGADRFTVLNNGNIDINGPTSVTSGVDGVMTINGTGVGENAALRVQGSGADRFTVLNNGIIDINGPTSVTSSLDGALTVNGTGVGENAALRVQGGGTDRLNVLNNGNVGIGTTTPAEKLDVAGSINISPSGSFKQDNTTVLHTNINHNTFVGRYAGYGGYWNTAVGEYSLDINTGYYNTAIGHSAMRYNTTGRLNTAVGIGALQDNTTGLSNSAIGNGSLYENTTGSENTALGYFALYELTEGNNNIAVGKGAGEMITTGSNNIIIGYEIDAPDPAGSNQLSIGNLIFGTGIDGTGTTISSGNIGIGTNAPAAKLDVAGNAYIQGELTVDGDIQGDFTVDGNIGIGTSSPATGLEISYQGVQSSNPVRFSGLPAADNVLMESFTDTGYEGWKLVSSGTQQEMFYITDPAYNKIFTVDAANKEVGVGTGDPEARFHVRGDGTATTGGQILISGETDVNDRMWIGFDTTDNYGFIQSSADGVTEDLILNADGGNVGIGTVNPQGKLHTEDLLLDLGTGNCPTGYTEGDFDGEGDSADCKATGIVVKADGSVGIGTTDPGAYRLYVEGEAYATIGWTPSDEKFKKNISSINNALSKVTGIDGVSYEWKTDEFRDKGFPSGRHYGVVGQKIEKILPEIVKESPNGEKSVAYTELIPVLIEAVKEQQKIINELREKVQQIEAKDYMAEAAQ